MTPVLNKFYSTRLTQTQVFFHQTVEFHSLFIFHGLCRLILAIEMIYVTEGTLSELESNDQPEQIGESFTERRHLDKLFHLLSNWLDNIEGVESLVKEFRVTYFYRKVVYFRDFKWICAHFTKYFRTHLRKLPFTLLILGYKSLRVFATHPFSCLQWGGFFIDMDVLCERFIETGYRALRIRPLSLL